MSARTTALVVEREVREAARRKAIWVLIALVFLGSTAMVVLPSVLPDDRGGTVMIVGDDDAGLADALTSLPDRQLEVTRGTDRETARLAVAEGEADLAIVLGTPPVLLVEDTTSSLVTTVRELVANRLASSRLAELGIDSAELAQVFADVTPELGPIDVERQDREGAAFGLTFVLYLLTVTLTGQVANGVATEKANRVSEVLLAIVPPRSMLIGKVLGVGAIGLTTMLAAALPVLAKLTFGGDLPANFGRTLAVSAVWFVGGLALYLTIAGALGALVSRQEEVGAIVTPLTLLLVAGYIVSISASDSVVAAVVAYIPLFSPMVEPFRIAVGEGSPVEYAVSLAILLVTTALVIRVATAVFRRAIVRTGRRLKLREVLVER